MLTIAADVAVADLGILSVFGSPSYARIIRRIAISADLSCIVFSGVGAILYTSRYFESRCGNQVSPKKSVNWAGVYEVDARVPSNHQERDPLCSFFTSLESVTTEGATSMTTD